MTSDGKLKAEAAVRRVNEKGRTNLSGGLLAALEALYHIKEEAASLVESVLLFTDGKANVGIRDHTTIAKATKYVYCHHTSATEQSHASSPHAGPC
jgi:Mg-chelatase subunit ChlD